MLPLFAPIIQLFLTIYYFFYFLAKGKPEWKCPKEKHEDTTLSIKNVCCEGEERDVSNHTITDHRGGLYTRIRTIPSTIYSYWKRFVQWTKGRCSSIYNSISIQTLRKGLARMCAFVVYLIRSTWQIISTFFSTIFSYLLFRRAPSKTMSTSDTIYTSKGERDIKMIPSSIPIATTPVPFSPSSIPPPPPPPPPPRSNRVPSSHKEEVMDIHDEISKDSTDTFKGGAFYTTRVFNKNEENDSVKDTPIKSIPSLRDSVKGGIAVFPPSMMAEIAGSRGSSEQVTRSEVNRTPNPTVKERLRDASLTPVHKGTFEYTNTDILSYPQIDSVDPLISKSRVDTPKGWASYHEDRAQRAKSAGPPRVSRIEDSSSNEAQFIFRPHGSSENMEKNYRMGSSVYYPIDEIDRMRPTMNRVVDSRATTPSIWSCNNSRMSTPALYNSRDDEGGMKYRGRSSTTRGRVGDTARSWPPSTNAEGADIGKECFIDGDGIITTTCTRIVQKKNEESWRSYDNNGDIIDEKREFSLMGDKDELRRGGPYQADQYTQHYFVDRDGTKRFENIHRQYDKDYVVESVCTNY